MLIASEPIIFRFTIFEIDQTKVHTGCQLHEIQILCKYIRFHLQNMCVY
jgi:hypothetical protein